jgi:hypothetical protein
MGQESFGNITTRFAFQVVCNQHLSLVCNLRSLVGGWRDAALHF